MGVVGVGDRSHSVALTWDGDVLALGWQPGGGAPASARTRAGPWSRRHDWASSVR